MIQLSHFNGAAFKPSNRVTRCRNCDDWSGLAPVRTKIPAKHPRIVVTGGFGPATRNLTLCQGCARHALDQLETLHAQLRQALDDASRADLKRLLYGKIGAA